MSTSTSCCRRQASELVRISNELNHLEKIADKWKGKPKGWTNESRKKFWDSLTGDVKHRVTKCIKKMEGKMSDPGAFCASLADRVTPGWRDKKD